MNIKTEEKSFVEFNLILESENTVIKENLAVYNSPQHYLIDPDFKAELVEVLRDMASFENLSFAEFLMENILDKDKNELFEELIDMKE